MDLKSLIFLIACIFLIFVMGNSEEIQEDQENSATNEKKKVMALASAFINLPQIEE